MGEVIRLNERPSALSVAYVVGLLAVPIVFVLVQGRPSYGQGPLLDVGSAAGSINLALQLSVIVISVCFVLRGPADACSRSLWLATLSLMVPQMLSAISHGRFDFAISTVASTLVLLGAAACRMSLESVVAWVRVGLRVVCLSSLALAVLVPDWAFVPARHAGRSFFGLNERLLGVASGPNYLGVYAGLLLCVELYASPRGRASWFFRGCAVVVLVWSQGRTGLAFGALLLLLGIIGNRWVQYAWAKSVVRITVSAALLAPFALVRLLDADWLDEFSTSRSLVWGLAWEEGLASPIFGAGPRVFEAGFLGGEFSNAHSQLLESFALYGVLGVFGLVIFLGIFTSSLFRAGVGTRLVLALFLVVLVQLPFGTPFRMLGVSFNVVPLSLVMLTLSAAAREADRSCTST